MIITEIPSDYIDIALARKCNTIDLPALQSASKTCEKSLLRYLSFPDIDNSYCDRIYDLLDRAESWALNMVQAYNNAEVPQMIPSIVILEEATHLVPVVQSKRQKAH